MHFLVGIIVTIGAFLISGSITESTLAGGLLNPRALVLLAVAPLSVALISHPFSAWRRYLQVLVRAFRHDRHRNLVWASDEMSGIARAVRESRWEDAEAQIDRAKSEQVRHLAPHLLERLEPAALHEAVANSSFKWMVDVKAAEAFVMGLARSAPAFGMIGTIMGLVELFKNMKDSASLGPGMAMALLATLYGLVLCYCAYMPLALRIRTYLTAGAHEQRVIERAINLIVLQRPVGEVRSAVLDGSAARSVSSRAPAPSES